MPATITDLPTACKPQVITHYALYGDIEGTAELVSGSGYLFRRDGERRATLVSYTDPALLLFGLVNLAPAADERPLWQQIADPATYEGTYGRDLVRGRTGNERGPGWLSHQLGDGSYCKEKQREVV